MASVAVQAAAWTTAFAVAQMAKTRGCAHDKCNNLADAAGCHAL